MIGIIASMQTELIFTEKCTFIGEEKSSYFTYKKYSYEGKEFITSVCETGKVSASVCTQEMILKYNPEIIINTGTSGSLKKGIKCKDIVIALDCVQHDLDVSAFGYKKGEHPDLKKIEFPSDEKFVETTKSFTPEGYALHYGRILTGDCVVVDSSIKAKLVEDFNGDCVEMEGGAVAQVCHMYGVKFGLLRSISDGDGDDDEAHEEFRTNMQSASEKCGDVILHVIKEY